MLKLVNIGKTNVNKMDISFLRNFEGIGCIWLKLVEIELKLKRIRNFLLKLIEVD